ncbi:hypothetical protein ABG768_003110 [Culter alburnus]|uniref:Fibronectin type-III domain-containing protein n=1 Tax=Culter alburnus TaxID=194366 RepID=A0AAW2A502_CULAL
MSILETLSTALQESLCTSWNESVLESSPDNSSSPHELCLCLDEVADKHEEEMTTLSSFIVAFFFLGFSCSSRSESCVAGNVSLSVSVSNNSTLLVEWNSGSKQTTQCALLISTEGRQEIQIHLVPRSGSLLLENMTDGLKHFFLCTCFEQSQGLLCSKNITFVMGAVSTPALVLMSDTQNSASYISMRWLSSGVFGATLATCVILLVYIIYRRWTGIGVFRLLYSLMKTFTDKVNTTQNTSLLHDIYHQTCESEPLSVCQSFDGRHLVG